MKYLPLLLLLLTGCNEAATPEDAIKHFLHAVRTQSVSEAKDYLAWNAYSDYANKAGLSKLKKLNLSSYNVIAKTGHKQIKWNRFVDYYTAEIAPLWVRVACMTENQDEGYGVTFCWLDVIE